MQTTLEVRWFLEEIPPAIVQHWFKFECPGQLLTPKAETREDLYACGDLHAYIDKFKEFAPNLVGEAVNLKLREGKLELKLKQKQFGIQTFTDKDDRSIWSGRIEQWCKLSQQELEAAFNFEDLNWISVYKERSLKSFRGVRGELTRLETEGNAWWSIAFEMTTDNNFRANFFHEVVEQAAKTYDGPQLLAEDSCGYVRWLYKFILNQSDRSN